MSARALVLARVLTCAAAWVWPAATDAQTVGVQGQLSTWLIVNDQEPSTPVTGIRYIPQLNAAKTLSSERSLDGEISLNGYSVLQAPGWDQVDATSRLKPYRMWARFKTARFEARVGLQKINFGSATLLRPLMWFDSVDPRDPLQITDGVYGALVRQVPAQQRHGLGVGPVWQHPHERVGDESLSGRTARVWRPGPGAARERRPRLQYLTTDRSTSARGSGRGPYRSIRSPRSSGMPSTASGMWALACGSRAW